LRLLLRLHGVAPRGMKVIVMADRGLYARWLFKRIRRLGWHPMLRVNAGGNFCPAGKTRFVPFKELAPQVATLWLVSVGGEAEAEIVQSTVPELVSVKIRRSGTQWRATGIFRRGAGLILAGLLNHELLPVGRFLPEDWPTSAQVTQLSTGGETGMRGGP